MARSKQIQEHGFVAPWYYVVTLYTNFLDIRWFFLAFFGRFGHTIV